MKQTEVTLNNKSLNTFTILFFVIATASPLTGVVGALPISFLAGNGAGVPGIFLLVGILLTIFSFGFIAMSKYISNSGAFYAYISNALGVKLGLSGLSAALLTYIAMIVSCSAMFGFFTQKFIGDMFHLYLPWWFYTLGLQILVTLLGILKVEVGSKVLGLIMLLEIGIIFLLDFSILKLPLDVEFSSFQPTTIFSGSFGFAFVMAVCSFIGFEATAIYSEECENPHKVIKKVTFLSISIIAVFYAFTSWTFVQFNGANHIVDVVSKDPGNFIFNLATQVLEPWAVIVINILLITSLFAATQALHNSLARYLYVMSKDGLIHSALSKIHKRHHTPYKTSIFQSIFFTTIFIFIILFQLDPIVHVFAWASAVGSISFLTLLLGVSISIIFFFQKKDFLYQASLWSRFIAPTISAIFIIIILIFVVKNIKMISGVNSNLTQYLPWLVIGSITFGYFYACYLQFKRVDLYRKLHKNIQEI